MSRPRATFDKECHAFWCPECPGSSELTLDPRCCTTDKVVLSCRTCLYEEVFYHEATILEPANG